MKGEIDLHAHTTASDGSLRPAELIDLAARIGLKAVAVTDHDTVDGLAEALDRGLEIGFEVIAGLEISARFSSGAMHILGYRPGGGGDWAAQNSAFPALARLQAARAERNPAMIDRLVKAGLDVTMEEVRTASGGGQVGRPHFARVLVDKGYAVDVQDAFNKYLAQGRPGYVAKYRPEPHQALAMIIEAGGLPVLAHPLTLGLGEGAALTRLLFELKEQGLVGLEAYYSDHDPAQTKRFLSLAEKIGLIATGGSDFHGPDQGWSRLGEGFGRLAVPYQALAELKRRAANI